MRLRSVLVVALACLLAVISAPGAQAASGQVFAGTYVSPAGARSYTGYVPSSYRPGTPMPLVVALHGCVEGGVDYAQLTRWSQQAEERGFVVVYPTQSRLANPGGCWNFFLPTNQHRGAGEPSLIAGITAAVRERYSIDPARVYVTGASAGGAMTSVMAVTYPDVFAAAGIVAGCEYRCDVTQLVPASQQGQAALAEMGSRARPVPVIAFQGTADVAVRPSTLPRIVTQFAVVGGTDGVADASVPGQVPGGRSFTHVIYDGASGAPLIETYLVDGAGHAYPGGCAPCLFSDPGGPDATGLIWDFFAAHPL